MTFFHCQCSGRPWAANCILFIVEFVQCFCIVHVEAHFIVIPYILYSTHTHTIHYSTRTYTYCNLTQHAKIPTHSHGHTLDFILTPANTTLNSIITSSHIVTSDHYPIFATYLPHQQPSSIAVSTSLSIKIH